MASRGRGLVVRPISRLRSTGTSSIGLTIASQAKLDLIEDVEKNLITAIIELPGITKQDVQLTIQNGTLMLSAENKTPAEHQGGHYLIHERSSGKWWRSLSLPRGIAEEDIKASMADGVLTITYPRSSPTELPKTIPID